ncbi:hypothetical protein EMIHUDRAFT_236677 [Emiliania huxleyi CCMP1516]|uniref:Bestrophin homolog n=2 Tax=Emiliania huxleyi TaxID=2903 RepID=A0A0D3JSZ9_EMIH1|nr:hypothetical protein EMIHUDRAFT_236677 [Emiliania huxleyi CCMP1516]EOD26634.1 hypothetical protein EMIHUDRAFT_236677 [Emiliania huxleyi CCMP1516]|eukprot:XP_005779063.1 hypothetical protein EMIHUDRAFT_236677 [Emiliania huxleyi CCMP1516]
MLTSIRRIAKESPTLQHTETWFETLVSGREYLPTRMWWAYDRWWEARKLWGQIVNSTRNVASNAAVFMTDLERKRRVIKATICFAWCTKASLRGVRPTSDEIAELASEEMLTAMVTPYVVPLGRRPTLHLEPSEYEKALLEQGEPYDHLPMMMAGVRDELDETVGAKGSAAEVHEGWKIVIGNDIKSLVDALGGCERIQKTPMPFGYLAQQRIFMLIWLCRWASIAVCAVVSFIMLKVDNIGIEIEHPFGTGRRALLSRRRALLSQRFSPAAGRFAALRPLPTHPLEARGAEHDLPLEAICITIEKNLLEILRRAESRELRPEVER